MLCTVDIYGCFDLTVVLGVLVIDCTYFLYSGPHIRVLYYVGDSSLLVKLTSQTYPLITYSYIIHNFSIV